MPSGAARNGWAGERRAAPGSALLVAVRGRLLDRRTIYSRPRRRHPEGAPMSPALIEVVGIGKSYGSVVALADVSTVVNAGEVTCVLGDNGAGKSTLIKILAGVHRHDRGELRLDGAAVRFRSPREALDRGIATVYQDLALVPLLSVWRNFVLGAEPVTGRGVC